MSFFYKIKSFFYNFILNALEFVFFFTHYWWWKFQWQLIKHYWNTSGYQIYQEEKHKTIELDERNFTFGESTALTTKLLLSEIEPEKGSLIYDLGSGRGVFLFSAYFMFHLRGVGIEIFKTYVEKSLKIRKDMKTAGVTFKRNNIAEVDLTRADIVYITATTFQDDVMEQVYQNLEKTAPGTIIIIVRKTLPTENFVLFHEGYYPFTWGSDKVYFYRRK